MIKRSSLLLLLCAAGNYYAAAQQNTVTINTAEARHTISKHIYGHFAEHLGSCIYKTPTFSAVVLTLK